jgi:hypothetical protein
VRNDGGLAMTKQEQIKLQLEERLRVDPIFREYYPKLLAIPLKEVHIELKGKIAQAAKANPDSVRVVVNIPGEPTIISRGVVKVVEVK